MSGIRTAIRYAKATINFSRESGTSEKVFEDMKFVKETVSENKDLQILLSSPVIKSSLKRKVLMEIFEQKTSTITVGLIDLLIDNKRLALLGEVAKQYTILFDYLRGKEVATVTTAVPLTDSLNEKVLQKVKEVTGGNNAQIENKIDPEILGGFILRVGDVQYDASIASRLQLLKREFDNESYIPKL